MEPAAPLSQIKILSFKDKDDWTLETKYNIGKKKEEQSVEKFSDFISEQKNEQPYRFVIIHNEPENMTDDSRAEAEELADNFIKAGKSLGLEGFKCKIEDSYLSRKGNKLFIHNTDDKEFLLDENTVVFNRSKSNDFPSWQNFYRELTINDV